MSSGIMSMECVHAGARREPGRPGVAWPLPPRNHTPSRHAARHRNQGIRGKGAQRAAPPRRVGGLF